MPEFNPKGKTIYLDMDGVICNFTEGLLAAHNRHDLLKRHYADTYPKDWMMEGELGTEEELWEPVDALGEPFWENLNPLKEMEHILTILDESHINWYLCTHARNTPFSFSGKIKWIHKHLGKDFDRLIMCKVKSKLANPNTLLIDDSSDNCRKFIKAGGNAFAYPQPHNENSEYCSRRVHTTYSVVKTFLEMPKLEWRENVRAG